MKPEGCVETWTFGRMIIENIQNEENSTLEIVIYLLFVHLPSLKLTSPSLSITNQLKLNYYQNSKLTELVLLFWAKIQT